ncbi:MAG: 2OG-Fe(II) oxygenase family protein [Sphingopyxis sp.]
MHDEFFLSPLIDATHFRTRFAQRGRVEISDFLGHGQAEKLRAWLIGSEDWVLILNAGDKVYEIPRASFSQLTQEQRDELDRRVIDAGRKGFQYRYESIRVPDGEPERQARANMLDRFIGFMSSAPVLNLLSFITGEDGIAFADGQATAFSPGHFLTRHDDDVAGKGRYAAYVMGLVPAWKAQWGGLLMFHGADGNIEEAYVPNMGALRLFAVPAPHSVSYVTPFAPEPRLSITGWLRSNPARG